MGQRGRPTAQIVLSDDERETLERWARRPKTGQALALRCRIVLAASTGITNQQIARELSCNAVTVGKWRTRFAEKRFDGLIDEPRPGQPRKVTDDLVEQVAPDHHGVRRYPPDLDAGRPHRGGTPAASSAASPVRNSAPA